MQIFTINHQLIMNDMFNNLQDSLKFKCKCPFKPGIYEIKDYKFLVSLPEHASLLQFAKACATIRVTGIVNGTKGMVDLMSAGGKAVFEKE
jgi:hypothetical protein